MNDECVLFIGDAGGHYVEVRPLFRSHDATDYWDGNWVECRVAIHAGGFTGDYRASLRADEFAAFRDQVEALNATLKGEARYSAMEEQLDFTLKADAGGHVEVRGVGADQSGVGNVLSFHFDLDQTYLPPILRSLNCILRAFPVLGSPTDA